ncbi:MAG TPA: ABC transporter permease [Acidimicrobiales bacterium]
MARSIGLKLLLLLPVVFIVSVATFLMTEALPGDPAIAILGENATPEQIEVVRQQLGLDKPIVERYVDWAGDALSGDLGRSLRSNQPVWEAFRERLPVTLQLAVMAELIALVLSIPMAAWSAWRAGGRFDRATSAFNFAIIGLPSFVLGLIFVSLFALRFEWFPVTGWVRLTQDVSDNLKHAFLPALTLGLFEAAIYTQLLRADMAATLQEDFVLAARSRGLPSRHILLREALRPSSFSLITLAGVNLGRLIGGTVIVETLFGLGGVGTLITQAIPQKDFPVLQGSVLILALAYLVINTAVDVAYNFIDPRVRRGNT